MNTSRELISPQLQSLDTSLYDLVKGIDILTAVAPLNYQQERQAFFDVNYSKNPNFIYGTHEPNVLSLKRSLFNLPMEHIVDDDLRNLYLDIVDSYVDKIDQFKSIGTVDFLYDSLRYYGEPTQKDLRNANFILHLPNEETRPDNIMMSAIQIREYLENFAIQQGYEYEIQVKEGMIANALVSGKVVKINAAAMLPKVEVQALAHHELGVHLLTTLNSGAQPLRLLSAGCPVNTMTQEGLAILAEFLAGYLTVPRLKVLALRVLAVDSMIKEKDFRTTFLMMKEQYHMTDIQAFTITARVYRGGGFTKDYVYLQGFHQMLNEYESNPNFNDLLCGKTSIDYLPQITRLIDKGYLVAPKLISPAFSDPQRIDGIRRFVAQAIQ